MKYPFNAVVIAAAILFGSTATSALASQDKKVQGAGGKKPVVVSAKKAAPVAQKVAVKTQPQARAPQKVAARPAPSQAKTNSKSALALAEASRKPLRRISASDFETGRLALGSSSALVIDQSTGHPLFEKSPDAVLPIASISKLMTSMVVLDAKLDMQEVISIGEADVDTLKGTRSRLPVGTTMTRETEMLLALMSSENRAANALGRHYPGGLPAFVAAMNRKAQSLGMFHSRFEEPTGLSSNNVSTAHDLARMVTAAARYPEIRTFSTTAEAKVELNGRIRDFGNTNALVRNDHWDIGVSKTGYISEAGRCLVMQARVAEKPVVIVLLDSVGKMTRVGDAIRIKRWMESASLGQDRRNS